MLVELCTQRPHPEVCDVTGSLYAELTVNGRGFAGAGWLSIRVSYGVENEVTGIIHL